MSDKRSESPPPTKGEDCYVVLTELSLQTHKPMIIRCVAETGVGTPHEWLPPASVQTKSTSHVWLHHEARIPVDPAKAATTKMVFRVYSMTNKKCVAQFSILLGDLELRHSCQPQIQPNSFTGPESGIRISFKAHLHSVTLLRNQLLAMEDDEKLMAVQDIISKAKAGDGDLHDYLMNEPLLHALLDLTTHWLHDALFSIEIASIIPTLWRSIINCSSQQCIQYFNLSDGSDSDFFEYFVDSMTCYQSTHSASGGSQTTTQSSPSASTSSHGTYGIMSPIFFNRERKIQMIQLFAVFGRKSVSASFRYSMVAQVTRLVELVARYLCSADSKSSTPRSAQEEFMVELLSQSVFQTANLARAPYAVLLPTFCSMMNAHNTMSVQVLTRVLDVLKELPPPAQTSLISECNLLSCLDVLTEHPDSAIQKLANFNWSKYMLCLTSKPSALKGNTALFASLDVSASCTASS